MHPLFDSPEDLVADTVHDLTTELERTHGQLQGTLDRLDQAEYIIASLVRQRWPNNLLSRDDGELCQGLYDVSDDLIAAFPPDTVDPDFIG